MTLESKNEEETRSTAYDILDSARKKKREGALSFALYGDLGAGKTTFTRALAEALGVGEMVRSPTFLLMRECDVSVPSDDIQKFIHIDAYRVESAQELADLNIETLLQDPAHLVVIEWAERAEEFLPKDAVRVRFEVTGEHNRTISVV